MKKCVGSIDIGGTSTRVSLWDLVTGREIRRSVVSTIGHDYGRALKLIVATIENLVGDDVTLVSVGAGVAGMVKNGVIIGAGNLPDWIDQNFKSDLESQLHVPAVVMNDAEAAALGEYTQFGQAMVYIIWGTGVGGAIVFIINGSPVVRATELGHMTIVNEHSGLLCGCAGYGHLEAMASGANIPKQFAGRRAEELSDDEWSCVLRHMAVGLRNVSTIITDTPVVLGGGVAIKQQHRLPELQQLVDNLTATCPAPALHIAKLGEDAGLVGAMVAARQLVPAQP